MNPSKIKMSRVEPCVMFTTLLLSASIPAHDVSRDGFLGSGEVARSVSASLPQMVIHTSAKRMFGAEAFLHEVNDLGKNPDDCLKEKELSDKTSKVGAPKKTACSPVEEEKKDLQPKDKNHSKTKDPSSVKKDAPVRGSLNAKSEMTFKRKVQLIQHLLKLSPKTRKGGKKLQDVITQHAGTNAGKPDGKLEKLLKRKEQVTQYIEKKLFCENGKGRETLQNFIKQENYLDALQYFNKLVEENKTLCSKSSCRKNYYRLASLVVEYYRLPTLVEKPEYKHGIKAVSTDLRLLPAGKYYKLAKKAVEYDPSAMDFVSKVMDSDQYYKLLKKSALKKAIKDLEILFPKDADARDTLQGFLAEKEYYYFVLDALNERAEDDQDLRKKLQATATYAEIALIAVKEQWRNIVDVNAEYLKNGEYYKLAEIAVKKSVDALLYVDKEKLGEDKVDKYHKLAEIAVETSADSLEGDLVTSQNCTSPNLSSQSKAACFEHERVVETAVKVYGPAIRFASAKLQKSLEIIELALREEDELKQQWDSHEELKQQWQEKLNILSAGELPKCIESLEERTQSTDKLVKRLEKRENDQLQMPNELAKDIEILQDKVGTKQLGWHQKFRAYFSDLQKLKQSFSEAQREGNKAEELQQCKNLLEFQTLSAVDMKKVLNDRLGSVEGKIFLGKLGSEISDANKAFKALQQKLAKYKKKFYPASQERKPEEQSKPVVVKNSEDDNSNNELRDDGQGLKSKLNSEKDPSNKNPMDEEKSDHEVSGNDEKSQDDILDDDKNSEDEKNSKEELRRNVQELNSEKGASEKNSSAEEKESHSEWTGLKNAFTGKRAMFVLIVLLLIVCFVFFLKLR